MDKMNIPDLLKFCQSEDFQIFAYEVHSGNDENSKLQVQKYLLKLANLCKNSRTYKKRPIENEIDENQVEKKIKIDPKKTPNLPQEIWLKIMNHLKTKDLFLSFGLVCKFFNGLTLDSRAVKFLEVKKANKREIKV